MSKELWLTCREAADIARVRVQTISRWASLGKVVVSKTNDNRIQVSQLSLLRHLARIKKIVHAQAKEKIDADGHRWLATSEAANMAGVKPTTIRTWAMTGQVRHKVTTSGHRLISETHLQQFLEDRKNLEDYSSYKERFIKLRNEIQEVLDRLGKEDA